MGFRFQRISFLLAALCAPAVFALADGPAAQPGDLNAEQIAQKFTPSVMLVISLSSGNPDKDALGTCYVLSEDGIVCTNYHVIDGRDKFVLKSSTGGTYDVTAVLATDKKRDIAILKVDAHKLTPLELADSSKVAPGEKVFVIGNPKGLESSISEGIVSSLREESDNGPCIQITAPISHGSSGSPVFNAQGKVIGMATFNLEGGQALNFAIPSNAVAEVLATAKNAKAPESVPAASDALYQPDPAVHGSKPQDASVFKDDRFGKLKEAEKSYDCFAMLSLAKQLVKDYPESSAASRSLCSAYYYASMPDEAFKAAHRALDLDPDSGRAWDDLAMLYVDYTDDADMAALIYAHAVELAPDDAKLLIEYSRGLRSSSPGTAQSALTHAKNLLMGGNGMDDETRDYHLYAELVEGYSFLGLHQDAYDTALQLLNKTTTDAWLYLAYASAAADLNKPTYVKATIEKAITLDPSCKKDALKLEASFYYGQGDTASAINLYKQACTMDSRDFSTLAELVYVISHKQRLAPGDYQDLDNYISELKSLNPKAGKAIEDSVAEAIKDSQ